MNPLRVLAVDDDDLILENFTGLVEHADEVVSRLGFDGNDWWQGFLVDRELYLLHGVKATADRFVLGEDVLVTYGAGGEARVAYEWAVDADSLSLTAVEECSLLGSQTYINDPAEKEPLMLLVTSQTFTFSGDDPIY